METVILTTLGLALLVLGVVMIVGIANVLTLGQTKIRPLSEKRQETIRQEAGRIVSPQWAQRHGFVWDGGYQLTSVGARVRIAAWQQQESPTYLCIYFGGPTKVIDIVSVFSEHCLLTTTNTRDGQFFPPIPGAYIQSFSGKDAAGLWQQHTEAEVLVAPQDFTEAARIAKQPFPEVVQTAIRQQMYGVRDRWGWPLMIPYWYFVRRFTAHGISVREQLEQLA